MDGDGEVLVELLRADPNDPTVIRKLLEIDLQSYTEATFSEHTATVLGAHAAVYLMRAADRAIGSCVFVRDFLRPSDAILLATGVLPGWRGRGLGEWMLRELLLSLSGTEIGAVVLHVGARNQRALRAYLGVGFALVDDRADPMDPGDRQLTLRAELR